MDPLVVVDAVAECMAYEEKELCKIGNIAILIMFKVAGKLIALVGILIWYIRRYFIMFSKNEKWNNNNYAIRTKLECSSCLGHLAKIEASSNGIVCGDNF